MVIWCRRDVIDSVGKVESGGTTTEVVVDAEVVVHDCDVVLVI